MFDAIRRVLGLGSGEPQELSEDKREEIREWIKEYLREGFAKGLPPSQVRDFVFDVLSGEMPDGELSAQIDAALPVIEAERASQMAQWPEVTDCDRLDAAFDELKAAGIIAEQNYWCCQTCASGDVHAALKKARKSGGAVPRGYIYYHEQDTEGAIHGEGLFLAYGAEQRDKAANLAIAREVVETLQKHGLAPDWNGNLNTRIQVPVDWKRRTPLPDAYREAEMSAQPRA